MQYEISFFIKIHVKDFYIQNLFKYKTPLLFFLIRTWSTEKKQLFIEKDSFFFCRLCKKN